MSYRLVIPSSWFEVANEAGLHAHQGTAIAGMAEPPGGLIWALPTILSFSPL